MVHHAGEIPRLTFAAGGLGLVRPFLQSQFKGARKQAAEPRAADLSRKGAAGASRWGGCIFAAVAKTAAWPYGIGCLEIVSVPFRSCLEIDSSRTTIADM